MFTDLSKNWHRSWILPLATTIVLMGVMYGMVPYTFRYNIDIPISLGHMLYLFWTGDDEWQHALLVFPISIGLIYWKREQLKTIPVQGHNSGAAIIFAALLLYWVGYKGDIKPFAFYSIQILLAGLTVWFFGWRMFLAVLFPWAFLAFAWPIPGLTDFLAVPLRELMSNMTAKFLNLIGIPALHVGTSVVSAPDFTRGLREAQRFALDVADPCSGIRSLFALTMVTALYGYLTLPKFWQKWLLFFAAIPLAVFGNFIRMLMLTFGTILMGSNIAIGTLEKPSLYHEAAGFAVFIAAILGMLGICWVLQYDWKRVWANLQQRVKKPANPPRS